MKKALIVQGGFAGHEPEKVSRILGDLLAQSQFEVQISDREESFLDEELLKRMDLIVPCWTDGSLTNRQLKPLYAAVKQGTGVAGCHGGMLDAYRTATEFHRMAGGQFVDHPGNDGVEYVVEVKEPAHSIMEGIKDFTVVSELYHLHVDPGNHVLAATTLYDTDMPVAWLRNHGQGKVFCCSLGHNAKVFELPEMIAIMHRGMLWAAR